MKHTTKCPARRGLVPRTLLLATLGLSPLLAQATPADPEDPGMAAPISAAQTPSVPAPRGPSFSVGAGMMAGPVYEGADDYAALPLLMVKGSLPTARWGMFSGNLQDGLRWDLPSSSHLGMALLVGYDVGRKESLRILGGHNTRLMGMGDLDSTATVGGEVSWRLSSGRLFARGMQATNSRHYGGDDLGRTSNMQIGVASTHPLSPDVTLDTALYGTWGDSSEMMSRFGVTQEQASRSVFDEYRLGRGMQDMTLKVGAHWQWTPKVSLEGGMKATSLVSNARNSPLVDKSVGASVFLGALYTF